MQHFARLADNVVVETFTPFYGFQLADSFHPTLVAQFESVPVEVLVGWTRTQAGKWLAPEPESATVPMPTVFARPVTSFVFKSLFTGSERVAIKNARASDDLVDDFFSMVEDPNSPGVDLTLQSTLDALQHLQSLEIITAERRVQILAGIAQ